MVPSPDGAQRLTGGDGALDRVSYAGYSDPVSLIIGGGAVSGSAADDTGTVRAKDQIDGDVEVLTSGAGADTLVGDADAERFDGRGGGDDIDGNLGTDTLTYETRASPVVSTLGGTAGVGGAEDTNVEVEDLVGGLAGDTLRGDTGPNLIDGGPGNDLLVGNGGDDVLLGGFGADNQLGNTGVDEVTYRDRADRVEATVGVAGASGNSDDGPVGSRDTINFTVERVVGSSDDDLLIGDAAANELNGGGGGDDLRGLGADDTLRGGSGPDVLRGGDGLHDLVTYAERTRPVAVTIGGAAGGDGGREDGPAGTRDTVVSDVEDLIGGAGADTLTGSAAANLLDGGLGGDTMQGLGGNDTVSYAVRTTAVTVTVGAAGASGSSFDGGTGSRDTVAVDVETVVGGDGNDTLNGADGAQALDGGPGDDTLDGRRDADDLIGNAGTDTATYASSPSPVSVTIGVAGASGGGDDGPVGSRDTVQFDVERAIGSSQADTLTGSANADTLEGSTGNDLLRGLGSNDILRGGVDDDTLEGGDGDDDLFGNEDNDTFDGGPGADLMSGFTSDASQGVLPGDTVLYDQRTTPINVNIDGGAVSGGTIDESGGVRDELTNIETVTGGSAGDTIARLSGTITRFIGGDGGDTLVGASGVDELLGGTGADNLDGAAGADLLDGGTQDDQLVGGLDGDTLQGGADDDDLDGGGGADTMTGDAGLDLLEGGAQDDDLVGGADADRLIGGFGADLIDGGLGIDIASYEDRSTAPETAGVTATIGATGGSGNADDGPEGLRDTIATDVETLTGGVGADTLVGNSAANTLNGGLGSDVIRGGHGVDQLRGGGSNDILRSRDTFADDLTCQSGNADVAEVDASDVAAADCETVIVG
jgi:Ca2+-binding RTX toxin-like protein